MAEPLGDKGIRDVPGIGDVLGAKLSEAGYDKVRSHRISHSKEKNQRRFFSGLHTFRKIFVMSERRRTISRLDSNAMWSE